jgi:starvation-inducible outer membrane lipoprotein
MRNRELETGSNTAMQRSLTKSVRKRKPLKCSHVRAGAAVLEVRAMGSEDASQPPRA